MNSKSIIEGENIKELFTRFFYRENHLYFQIIAYSDVEASNPIFEKEYLDYKKYKKAFEMLQVAKSKKSQVRILEKEENPNTPLARQAAC